MLFHPLTAHRLSTHPSIRIPSPTPLFPCLPPTFRTGSSDFVSLASPAHPPRPAESNNAATQPPTHPLPPPPCSQPCVSSRPRARPVTCLGGVGQVVAAAGKVSEFSTTETEDARVARLLQGPVQAPCGVLRLQAPRVPLRPVRERLAEKSRYRDGHHQGPAAAASPSGSTTSSSRSTATATSTSTTTAAPTATTTSLTRRHVPERENSPRQYSACAVSVGDS